MESVSRSLTWVLLVTTLVHALGCHSRSLRTEAAPGVRFPAATSYAWTPRGNVMMSIRPENRGAIQAALESAVVRELDARGWSMVSPGEADVHVRYLVGATDRFEVTRTGTMRVAGKETEVALDTRRLRDAQLIIELVDPSTETVPWRGVIEATFDGVPDTATASQRADRAVARLLGKLP